MKDDIRVKRYPLGLIILLFIWLASWITLEGTAHARRVNCDPSVYNPATKSCIGFYCHSNGKGEYRPIRWQKRNSRLDCTGCHDFPPQGGQHRTAKRETCGQTCHTQSINNNVTTDYHINGRIEGVYEVGEEGQCLACHQDPQGPHRPIAPDFQMISNHISGPPNDYDCIVCHMEDTQEYHKNGQIELKNHQGGPFYTLNQYNQFCLGCHDFGTSLFGSNPFSTSRPIPNIHNQLVSRRTQTVENARFWYPHNHMGIKGYNADQIMNQSGPNSSLYMDVSHQNTMLMRVPARDKPSSLVRLKGETIVGLMGGGGGMPIVSTPTIVGPVSAPIATAPILGGISPMMMAPLAPVLAASPLIGGGAPLIMGGPVIGSTALVASVTPVMGGGITMMPAPAPIVATPSPIMGGGAIIPGGGMVSPAAMAPGAGATLIVMPGMGGDGMNMIRSGIGNMVMGPSLSPLMGLDLIMGMPGGPMMGMPGPMMIMPSPMMLMPGPMMTLIGPGMGGMPTPMMGMIGPMMGMPTPMMGMPGPGMGGMPSPMMGMPGPGMGGMPSPMMGMPGPMMGMPTPMMSMPGPGMNNMPGPGMNNMPGPGMNNMPTPMMGLMPQPGNQGTHMGPTQTNNNNPQNQNQQNNEPKETTVCLACHAYENPDLLNLSVIAINFNGHFSHQNCIDCHASHGSQVPGLLKQGINWNMQNKSCNVQFCHPPAAYRHNPPLASTGISYEIRPESSCNTASCHTGSIQNSMFRLKIIMSLDSATDLMIDSYENKDILQYKENQEK